MHPISSDRAISRHEPTRPEFQPGHINWEEAERLRPQLRPRIHVRGRGFQAVAQLRLFDRRRSPNRDASLKRRRRLAMSGPMPPGLACHFTVGELAVLRIVGDECRQRGRCLEFIDAVAARAGVSRSTVKNALRTARRLGLVAVTERRITGTRNDSNVVTVISPGWLAWLRHKPANTGVKFLTSTDNQRKKADFRGRKSQDLCQPP